MSRSGNRLVDVLPRAGLITHQPFLGTIRHDITFYKNIKNQQIMVDYHTEEYAEKTKRRAIVDAELATMMDLASKAEVRACLHPFANMTTNTAATTCEDIEMAEASIEVARNNHLLRLLGYDVVDQPSAAPATEGQAGEQDSNSIDEGNFFHYLAKVQKELAWAKWLTPSLFNTLFCNVLQARVTWNNSPRPPFDPGMHSSTAKAAQRLLEAEPEMWSTIEALTSLPAR